MFRTEYTFNYDSDGNPETLASTKKLKADGSYQTTSYSYNARNQFTTTTYADGSQYVLEYESDSLYPTRVYWKDQNGNTLTTGEQTFTYDQAGNRLTATDAMGNTTTYTYDDKNRPVQVTNALSEETHYTYEDNNLVQVESGRSTDSVSQEVTAGQIILLNYDGKNRITSIGRQDSVGAEATYQSYTYDSLGRRLSVSDALGNGSSYGYDLRGNLTSFSDVDDNTTTYTYDALGNRTQVTDVKNRVTLYSYDEMHRLVQTENQALSPSLVTSYSYDAADNLLTVTDPENNTTTYTYDRLRRKTAEQRPGGAVITYSYDERNRLASKTGARGQVLQYTYEDWGGLAGIEHFASATDYIGNNAERTQGFTYNNNARLTQTTDSAIQVGALYTHSYDALNRLEQTASHYIPGGDRTLAYSYNSRGSLSGISLDNTAESGGTLVSHIFTYDDYSRLNSATLAANTHTLNYDSADRWTDVTYASGVSRTNTYNDDNTLASATLVDANSTTLEALSYAYDAVNNIEGYTDNDGTKVFTYDGMDRLTGADYPDATGLTDEQFDYDGVGNREDPSDSTVYEYNTNNQLVSQNNEALIRSYDDDGNLTSITGAENKTFTYDRENRLASYTDGSTSAGYGYGTSGRRLYKTVDGTTTWFLWGGTQVIAEFIEADGSASLSKRYDYLPGAYAPLQVTDSNGTYEVFSDHLDTPRVLVDATGQVVWRSVRTAFGETTVDEDVDGDGTTVVFNVRFPGQYYDSESGLHYNYFRDYDPSIGRYIQSDPIGLSGGLNTYGYALQNPLSYIDLLGLTACTWGDTTFTCSCKTRTRTAQENCRAAGGIPLFPDLLKDDKSETEPESCPVDGSDSLQSSPGSPDNDPEDEGDEGDEGDDKDKTEVTQSPKQAPKQGEPDSIHEQLDSDGNVRSRTFYDSNGRSFNRQDYDHSHGGMQPHQHSRDFDASGRPTTKEVVGPVPEGYDSSATPQ
ncbi:RHS repeat domain-containing protein [Microbulbifer sp. VAAF005]|uniref:RHS repeat domain-containing protein n=1 Tax=Microbulbifer sp. VAAF005 TaxID=3034230 RepID=UPI0024ACA8FE|nr:RHS repeat domain-containing protein [Microbulbifer sp. VAAF005]WHI46255.1 RHS repeat-associated core domain-containing protein [Microbulbifer sp. VAAF005]